MSTVMLRLYMQGAIGKFQVCIYCDCIAQQKYVHLMHIDTSLWSQSANWLHPIHLHLIITWGFVMYWNSSAIFTMHLFQMFAWSSVNRLPIAYKCFVRLLASIISVEHLFEWHTFQKWLCVGSRWVLPEKQQKMWGTIVEFVHADCYQSVSSLTWFESVI